MNLLRPGIIDARARYRAAARQLRNAGLETRQIFKSMTQSPIREPNKSTASQEILLMLWNPSVHYRSQNSPQPVPILNQINPVLAPYPNSWRYILILSSHLRLRLPSSLFLPRFNHQKSIYISPPLCVLHVSPTSYFFIRKGRVVTLILFRFW